MMASVVEGYSVHILSKGIAAAGRKAMDDLYARYAAGQRLCVERDLPGHGRDYPVVKNIVEESGKGISGEVNGHQVRVGRFAYVTADESGFMPVLHMPDAKIVVHRALVDTPEHLSGIAGCDVLRVRFCRIGQTGDPECAADVRFTRNGHPEG